MRMTFTFLMVLLAVGVWADGVRVELPSASRALAYQPEPGILVAAMALKGVAFMDTAGDGFGAPAIHEEWPTLYALPLERAGRFLLADRFGSLRLVGKGPEAEGYAELAEWPVEGIPTHLHVREGHLYVAGGAAGLAIYEWDQTEEEPQLRGRYPFVDYSKEIRSSASGIFFLADNLDTGLQVLDIADAQRPVCLAIQPQGYVDAVTVLGRYVAVVDRYNGMVVFDAIDPRKLKMEAAVELSGSLSRRNFASSVEFDGTGRLLFCEGDGGVRVFQLHPEEGSLRVEELARFDLGGLNALDGIFLPGDRIAVSTHEGPLILLNLSE